MVPNAVALTRERCEQPDYVIKPYVIEEYNETQRFPHRFGVCIKGLYKYGNKQVGVFILRIRTKHEVKNSKL